jgi:chemotaxis signal transduction protein
VDAIGDAVEGDEKRINAPPANIKGIESTFITGVLPLKDELVLILSAEKLIR